MNLKKTLSMALAAAMAISCMSVTAFAEGTAFPNTSDFPVDGNATVIKGAKPSIKFVGENDPREFKDGFTTSITFHLDPADYTHAELFEYSIAIGNPTDGTYVTEAVNSFQKTDDGIVWFSSIGNTPNAAPITVEGDYTLKVTYKNNNGKLRAISTFNGTTVTVDNFGATAVGATEGVVDITTVGFARYLWFVQVTAAKGVKVVSVDLPEYTVDRPDAEVTPDDEHDVAQEEAKEEAKEQVVETVTNVENVAEDIAEIVNSVSTTTDLDLVGNIPVAKTGTDAAKNLEAVCKAAGLEVAKVEVNGEVCVAPAIKLDVAKMGGNLPASINDMLVDSGIFLELKASDGKTYMIPTSLLTKTAKNRVYYPEAMLIALAVK